MPKNTFKLILVFSLFISLNLSAQYGPQFTNRGFEDWTTRDETSVSEPVHWHSNGTADGTWSSLMPKETMEQSGHPRPGSSGTKCVRLVPKSVLGITANGSITNGRLHAGSTSASSSDNYNYTKRSESIYNTPISQLPDSLTIWVCFRSESSSAQARVKAVVHGDTDYKIRANGTDDPTNMHVATADQLFTRTSTNGGAYTWRRLSIAFNNSGPCTDVRYLLMMATTNKTPGSGSTNDDLFLDDVLLIYNPTLAMGTLASHNFAPNDNLTIPFTLTGTMSPDNLNNVAANVVIAQMSNASGSFSNPTELGRVTTNTSGSITAQIPAVANGNYQIRVISTNYPMTGQNIQQVTITNPTYNITATANPSAGGSVSGAGEYTQGASCTLTATANTGYTFTNWTENGSVVSTNATYTFNVTSNRNLVANFSINTYNITATANPSAGGTVSGAGEYNHGQSCTLTATANTGYSFTNWTENGSVVSTNATYTFNVTSNRNLVANFSINTYNITATANPSAGGTVSGAGEYNHGQSCTLTATANTGYTFTNWTENGSVVSNNATYTFNVTSNHNLVANFTINTYNITATANPNAGGTVSGAGEYDHGQSCTLTATANTGYTFTNWTENGSVVSSNASYTFNVTGNRSLVANFSINTYNITATANPSAGGTVTGGGTYNHGASCTLTATPNEGYAFVKWTKNGTQVSTNATYTFTVTASEAYVAHFQLLTYNITATANPSAGGTVSGAGEYNYGQSCTVHATANEGYTFINWTENGTQVSANANYTFIVTGSRSLVAHFSTQSYIITAIADPTEGGLVTGSGGYDYGDFCTLTATANTGYTFANWTKDGIEVSTNVTYSFGVTESATYVAHFTINSYTISVTVDPIDSGTVNGAGDYEYGSSCTLTAIPNENYFFINWTKDGVEVSTDSIYTFVVTASESYEAHFFFFDNVEENMATIQLFPNPFTSKVSISAEKTVQEVRIYDLYGRLLKEQQVSETQFDVDLSDLSAGAYLLQIDYGNSRSVHRIMKSK